MDLYGFTHFTITDKDLGGELTEFVPPPKIGIMLTNVQCRSTRTVENYVAICIQQSEEWKAINQIYKRIETVNKGG